MLEPPGIFNGIIISVLIDHGAIKSFISRNSLLKCKWVEIEKNDFDRVEMASGRS